MARKVRKYIQPCRHCSEVRTVRSRGLCHACYFTPKIRKRYPTISKFGRRGNGLFEGSRPLPPPTTAIPGTEEKIQILELRAALGQDLWNPRDGRPDWNR